MKNFRSITIKHSITIASVISALVMSSSLVMASEDDHGSGDHSAQSKHIAGLFAGATKAAGNEVDGTIGIEYEYKFSNHYGLGVVYEKSSDAHHGDGVSVYAASVYWHPHTNWRLGLGAGEEKVHGSHGYIQSLVRASISYDFHVGGFGIAPTFNLDRVDGNNIEVYGITFIKTF